VLKAKAKPEGNYAIIKGDKGDPNVGFLRGGHGWKCSKRRRGRRATSRSSARPSPDGWKPDNAQKNMEQILTANNNAVDAVLAENDGMASAVVARGTCGAGS
jgi:D-xylose transport system substrate-binding protein